MADSDTDSKDETSMEANDGSRWVNTDSECKFLLKIDHLFNLE